MSVDHELLSKSDQHFTALPEIDAARELLDGIDLDPASCELANMRVQAASYYTKEQNGLVQPWAGKVFLNPPGGKSPAEYRKISKSQQALWWHFLTAHYAAGNVTEAVFIAFSIELFQNCQLVEGLLSHPLDFPVCIPRRRMKFSVPTWDDEENIWQMAEGKQPTHCNAIVYLPPKNDNGTKRARFRELFEERFGKVTNV